MNVVSLEPSEMEQFVEFKLEIEKEICGQHMSDPERWKVWAREGSLQENRVFIAKSEDGKWLGAAHWASLGDHEAKIFPILRRSCLTRVERSEVTTQLIGKVVHAILGDPEVTNIGTRPFLEFTDDEYIGALNQYEFHRLGSRVEFKSPVSQLPHEESNDFEWRPVSAEGELPAVAEIFRAAVDGYEHALDVLADPLGCIREALSESDLTDDLSGIHVGYIDNSPAAYIHVQVNTETGWSRITYMGILEKFRKRGLGVHVHRHGFAMIRERGGTLYHGGTSAENLAMISLFKKSHCIKYAVMQEWTLNVKQLREHAQQTELSTQRLRLEPLRTSHVSTCFELLNDERLYSYQNRSSPIVLSQLLKSFEFLENRISPDFAEYWWNWICIDKESDHIIGKVEVSYDRRTKEVFLAYLVFPIFWRQGYAKEFCSAVIEFLLFNREASKVIIEMDTRNKASVALAESLGARRVSHTAKVQLIRGGWSDEYRYEITKQMIENDCVTKK